MTGDERESAQDPHCAEGDNEGMNTEADDHETVGETTQERHGQAGGESESDSGYRVHRPGGAKHHRHRDAGQRVDGTDREVDRSGDDHQRGTDAHDGEGAGVGGHLDQRMGVEKVVDALPRDGVHVRTGNQRQERAQREQDDDQPRRWGSQDGTVHVEWAPRV